MHNSLVQMRAHLLINNRFKHKKHFSDLIQKIQNNVRNQSNKFCLLSNQKQKKSQNNQKRSYIRISKNQLQQQLNIYQWRKNSSNYIIPIISYKILSQGNFSNSTHLIKVILPKYKETLKDVNKLSLGQCLILAKSIIQGAKIIFQKFGYRQLEQNMIVIDKSGKIRIWVFDDYYKNPKNSLYQSENNEKSQKQALRAIIKILKSKCLKNKLSQQFLNFLQCNVTIQKFQSAIDIYTEQRKIVTPNQINFCQNIKMSYLNSGPIKIKTNQKDTLAREKKLIIFSNKLRQEIPQQSKNNDYLIKISNMTKTYQGSLEDKRYQKSKYKNVQNLDRDRMISSVSNSYKNFIDHKRNFSLQRSSFSQKMKKDLIKQKDKICTYVQDPLDRSRQIIANNGWLNNILKLPIQKSQMKISYNLGQDDQSHLKDVKLKNLQNLAGILTKSFSPVEQQFLQDQ